LGLPDDSFNYESFVREEFGGPQPAPPGAAWRWWVVVAIVFLILAGILVWR